ncbi:Dimer-Tnp-hAT domain-containing protein [Mycena chlorophos]|uniref:Dimer-Tnp-hAT domain-containing protein n=1 Tax=Mycena chlorophos TaxID=658473 RepID=A0A8H6WNP0_MYCCL|nr:Dimer-Tnp-hAT domain-containing protein [Mycena chlorophos]
METPCICASADVCRCASSRWRAPQFYASYPPTPSPFSQQSAPQYPSPLSQYAERFSTYGDQNGGGSSLGSPLGWSGAGSSPGTWSPSGGSPGFGTFPALGGYGVASSSAGTWPQNYPPGINTIPFPGTGQPLTDQTNAPTPTTGRRRRTNAASGNPAPPKRVARASSSSNPRVSVPAAATCGVGPSTPTASEPSADAADSGGPAGGAGPPPTANSANSRKRADNRNKASDPDDIPAPDCTHADYQKPGVIYEKPDSDAFPHLVCRLCPNWKVYANVDGFVTTGRAHLEKNHGDIYATITSAAGIKRPHGESERRPKEPYTFEGWMQRLMGCMTLDNASNNDTAMAELADLINADRDATIPFHEDGNRIRCYGHIINIAAQTLMKEIKENPTAPLYTDGAPDFESEDYGRVLDLVADLEKDICGMVRAIVSACRASGQRREDLASTIKQGNDDGTWLLPLLQLLRDCETRWSSTYNSNDRVFVLYPAIHHWLERPAQAAIKHLQLSSSQLQLLSDLQTILQPAHYAQELLSAEQAPTLSLALPAFELLLQAWLALQKIMPDFEHYIGVGVNKIIEYVNKGRKSRIYALAMIINPTVKIEWLEQHWLPEDVKQAEEWIIEAMTAFVTAERHARARIPAPLARSSTEPAVHSAAHAQVSGFERLESLANPVRRIVTLPSLIAASRPPSERTTTAPSTPAPTRAPTPRLTEDERLAAETAARAADRAVAVREFGLYKSEGLELRSKEFNLVKYWDAFDHVFAPATPWRGN